MAVRSSFCVCALVSLLTMVACSDSGTSEGSGGSAGSGGAMASGGFAGNSGAAGVGGGGSTASGGSAGAGGNAGAGGSGGSGVDRSVGEWTDTQGQCPDGLSRVDIQTIQELEDASRASQPGTCYFVHDGSYTQRGGTLPLYFNGVKGSAAAPIVWVGESRDGVRISGRVSFDQAAAFIELRNMTFDLSGFSATGSFNTITVHDGSQNIDLRRLTLTGDCATGHKGGHLEVEAADEVLLEDSIVERFGACSGGGHEDHGIYLASGSNITLRNNVIRENASRGIQLFTNQGGFGQLADVLVERNRIYGNGHADYEDGLVVNGSGSGPITGLTLRYNLLYGNYYSGIRFVGDAVSGVTVEHNTFYQNGVLSSGAGASEINLDGGTPAAAFSKNIFVPGHALVNACAGGLT
ncbi:MAG: right-handed parallel beta-helix repeat-containing protein, partial [Polyangiaceae bacterium]